MRWRTSLRMHRAAALPRVRAVPRLPRAAVWALAVIALLLAAGLWLRDSPLVAVQQVTVNGLSGPESARVTAQLESAARDMTTLHVRVDQLRSVVAPFPVVKSVSASAEFPHTLRITVTENTPVAAVLVDGTRLPVGGDGLLLRGADQRTLPAVPMSVTPGGDHVVDKTALRAIAALAAAPPARRTSTCASLSARPPGASRIPPRSAIRRLPTRPPCRPPRRPGPLRRPRLPGARPQPHHDNLNKTLRLGRRPSLKRNSRLLQTASKIAL